MSTMMTVSTAQHSLTDFTRFTRCKDMAALMSHSDPSLTHTFHLEMTPHSFPASAHTATDVGSKPPLSLSSVQRASPLAPATDSPMPVKQSRTHAKRRDPSYIPRPPNAFILFRSAFIRDQNIPGKVEGNHSKLSKIIGTLFSPLTLLIFCYLTIVPRNLLEATSSWRKRKMGRTRSHCSGRAPCSLSWLAFPS